MLYYILTNVNLTLNPKGACPMAIIKYVGFQGETRRIDFNDCPEYFDIVFNEESFNGNIDFRGYDVISKIDPCLF